MSAGAIVDGPVGFIFPGQGSQFVGMTRELVAASAAARAVVAEADAILGVLQASLQTKKGVTLNVKGQAIPMVVTAISAHFVEGRSQQSSKIAVRIASIDAASMA